MKKPLNNLDGLRVGMRVLGSQYGAEYIGTVYSILAHQATIKRDDRTTGSGDFIPEYGRGWLIDYRTDGGWGADRWSGKLYQIEPIELKYTCPNCKTAKSAEKSGALCEKCEAKPF